MAAPILETMEEKDVDLEPGRHSLRSPLSGGLQEPLLRKRSAVASRSFSHPREKHSAVVGNVVAPIESLDYELIENELFRQDWRSRTQKEILQYVVFKWVFVFLIGLLTGIVGLGINLAVENIAGFKFYMTSQYMKTSGYFRAALFYGGSNLVLVLFSSILVVYVSPAAAGSGIPEVKSYLNGIDTPEIFSLKTLVVKILGSVGAVAGGLIVGKQGPLVHMGSCIASLIGQGGSRKYHLKWRWLQFFRNDRDRRDLVTCGSAAGVAAAFRAPVGGVLFALEEVTSWWRGPLLWRAFFTTAVVAVVLRTGIAMCSTGRCGLFGQGGLIIFDTNSVMVYYGLLELLPVIVLGVIGGILGSLFNHFNSKIAMLYSGWLTKKWPSTRVFLACTIALITSICSFCLPYLAECRPCPDRDDQSFPCPAQGRDANYKDFYCPAGHYNDLATLFFNTNDDTTRNLFSTATLGEFRVISLLTYLVSCYFLAVVTYGIAVPSGLFVPSILCGATYGRVVGMCMAYFGAGRLDEGVYALLGAASFLGGLMRTTVSLCIILLELTNNLLMLPLIMLVLLVSKTVGDCFNLSVFDLHVKLKRMPYLSANPQPFMRQLSAADAISSSLVKFNVVEKVGTIVETLTNTPHNGYAVMDEDGTVFYGLVLRSHILVLLEKRVFLSTVSSQPATAQFDSYDFVKPASGKKQKIEDLRITEHELEMFVDLRPVTNTSPYTVLESMSLAKAFTLFRHLGLRHLCVMSRTHEGPPVVGLLTRHDFMRDYLYALYPELRQNKTIFHSRHQH